MKVLSILMMLCVGAAGLAGAATDVTRPGDPVIGQPNNNRWPGGEAPAFAIDDNVTTKYLHFRDGQVAGIIISPQLGTGSSQPTLVQSISLTTANDAADRDPHSYELSGSNAGVDGPWTLISAGQVVDFIGNQWPRQTKNVTPIIFDNQTEYRHYRLMFPILGGSSLFQIAEIELLAPPANGWAPAVIVTPAVSVVDVSDPVVSFNVDIDDFDSTSWDVVWTQVSGPAAVDLSAAQDQVEVELTFPAVRGTYVLQVDVTDDGDNASAPKQVTVRVWDSAVDNSLVAHWTFNEGAGTVIQDSAADDNRGYMGNYNNNPDLDPNFIEGWIPSAGANNFALNFQDYGYVEVIPDANSVSDPNLRGLDAGVSVAGWVHAYTWDGNRRIAQFGNQTNDDQNIFRLLREGGGLRFVVTPGTARMLTVPMFPAEQWHHVAATYDGKTIKIYVDGGLVGVQEYETYRLLYPYVNQSLFIGAKNKTVNPANYPGDYMFGMLDDLRVYSYAIDQDTVRSLVQMGENSAPVILEVDVPEILLLRGETTIVFSADVYDAHDDELIYTWTQVTPDPEDGPVAVISDANAAAPEVTFTAGENYTFRVTIGDGMYVTEQTFTVNADEADCDLVKSDGLLMAADLNGDCYVNLEDFAILAQNWLNCNDPMNPACDDPYINGL